MDVRYLFLFILITACMPDSQAPRTNAAKSTGTGTGTTTGSTTGGSTPTSTTQLAWNFLSNTSPLITINNANLNTAYLTGSNVESYLSVSSNFTNANYCVVADYSLGGLTYQLRSRVVPISYYDFSKGTNIRALRVDFPDTTNSTTFCAGTLRVQDTSGAYVSDVAPASLSYSPSSVCPTCTSTLSSIKVRIFKKGTTLDEVPLNLLNLSPLSLYLDPNNGATSGSGSCSNSSCQGQGLDCCLNNQCVKDGAIKPTAQTQYASLLAVAEEEKKTNPLAYLGYPQLYYICGSTVPTTPGGSTGGSYDAALEQLKKDYACVQNLKSQSSLSPFQQEILIRTSPYTATADCLTNDTLDVNEPQYYKKVVERLYKNCGCSESELSSMINSCPAYDYVIGASSGGVPTRIDCYTPPGDTTPLPTQLTVAVDSRSAPHRFFDSTGVERDILGGERSSSSGDYVQEGAKFEYLDDAFIVPSQQPFSMNAILGQMTVALDKALPAKSVAVEVDQVYQITTTQGLYSPCPSCARDSWISALRAHPSSTFGNGLQAVGHSVTRDQLSTNTTGGNYEDTIFGRACWLPPTMIPYSQPMGMGSISAQRQLRLQTQAALFANGYQREWFGFNRGALIGSFDGVTWFAIGKGRIVKASSKKLFLAINAPFADLAQANMHVVNVVAYNGTNYAPAVDYDPAFHRHDQKQNLAGSCQANHMCNTDTDCVSKLGWEYMCADVIATKSNWPKFDSNGNEELGVEAKTIDQILQQKRFPSGSTKRCVYRGAGAPCKVNSGTLTDLNQKKLMTCAPNFYCANLSSAGLFNSLISRYAAPLEDLPVSRNHLFGKDANILGRPLNYLTGADATLPSNIASAIRANFSNDLATGLCQPGKALPQASNETTLSDPFQQHQFSDPSRRTDFISQIGSCNSGLFTTRRYSSCPVINETTGNYEMFESGFNLTTHVKKSRAQNSCGLDSLNSTASLGSSADTLLASSPFKSIESKTLPTTTVSTKTFARDACLRRAGQVCHTDLDCGPSRFHAEQVDFFPLSFFGNEAEKKYYSETLICGQTDPIPQPTETAAYKDYDMSKNRCCRAVGSDLTTFTSDIPLGMDPTGVSSTDLSKYDPSSAGLLTSLPAASRAPGMAPNNSKRYSRFATVDDIGSTERPYLTAYQSRDGAGTILNPTENVLTPKQWKTLKETNSESCCGGGWIRKFSDGTNDWSRRNRVVFDVTNFACINSRTTLITHPEDVLSQYGEFSSLGQLLSAIQQDYGDYCKDGTNTKGSCAQYSISDSVTDTAPTADFHGGSTTINTVNPNYATGNLDYYFTPRSADTNSSVFIDYSSASSRRNITLRIPSYVRIGTISGITLINQDGSITAACAPEAAAASISSPSQDAVCAGTCCYDLNTTTRVLKVGTSGSPAAFAGQRAGVTFNITPAGSGLISRFRPGSNSYYLRRLGRLELSGIPQITHEPLYCSDNHNRLVPGIFNSTLALRSNFETPAVSFSNGSVFVANEKALENQPVFSANDFKCCTPLGKTTNSQNKCCSGFGTAIGATGKFTCALPSGTDLMVYFNRFVSNEGAGSDQPGGGLTDSDYNDQTGEPLLNSTVNQKISDLGIAYCASGRVRQGGAFGAFEPEPQGSDTNLSSRIYNIVDSSNDAGVVSNAGRTIPVGYASFLDGFRWNHHLYCDD